MKEVKRLKDKNLYLEAQNILRIANKAVQKAKVENKAMSIPEAFCKNGKIFYVLSNGKITSKKPAILK
ncbi:MAG: hypothetical protein AB8G86_22745 [Saprospiraceae bacterium]